MKELLLNTTAPDVNKFHFRTFRPDFFSSQVLLSLLSCLLQSLEIVLFWVLTYTRANSCEPYPLKEWKCNLISPFKSLILEEKKHIFELYFWGCIAHTCAFFLSSIENEVFQGFKWLKGTYFFSAKNSIWHLNLTPPWPLKAELRIQNMYLNWGNGLLVEHTGTFIYIIVSWGGLKVWF